MAPQPSDEELWQLDQSFDAAFNRDFWRLVAKVARAWAPLCIVIIAGVALTGAVVGGANLAPNAGGWRGILLLLGVMAFCSLFILVDYLETMGKFDSTALEYLLNTISNELFRRSEDCGAACANRLLFGKVWRVPFQNPTNREFYLEECELDIRVKGKGMNGVRDSWFTDGGQMLVKAHMDRPFRVPAHEEGTMHVKLGATLPGYMAMFSSSVTKVSRMLDIIVHVGNCEGTLADKTFLFETEFVLPLKVSHLPKFFGRECALDCKYDCYCSLKPALLRGIQDYQTKYPDWTVLQYEQLDLHGSILSVPRCILGVLAICSCWLVAMGSAKLSKHFVTKIWRRAPEASDWGGVVAKVRSLRPAWPGAARGPAQARWGNVISKVRSLRGARPPEATSWGGYVVSKVRSLRGARPAPAGSPAHARGAEGLSFGGGFASDHLRQVSPASCGSWRQVSPPSPSSARSWRQVSPGSPASARSRRQAPSSDSLDSCAEAAGQAPGQEDPLWPGSWSSGDASQSLGAGSPSRRYLAGQAASWSSAPLMPQPAQYEQRSQRSGYHFGVTSVEMSAASHWRR